MLEQFSRCKPHVKDPEGLFRTAGSLLEGGSMCEAEEVGDTVPDPEARVRRLFSYFRPNKIPERILVVPADRITTPTSGRSWLLGGDGYVVSHSTNPDNFDHETLHLIINPIVEGLGGILSPAQKKAILAMGAEKLQEKYGDDWYPMLCEELINTYKECAERNEPPETFESFSAKILTLSDEDFSKAWLEEGSEGKLHMLGIRTKSELLDRAKEYYERYVQNRLRERIYKIYQNYAGSDAGFEAALKDGVAMG